MEIKLGNLAWDKALERPELLGSTVYKLLKSMSSADEVGVSEIDPTLSDTAAFCAQYEVTMDESANCVILEGKRGEERKLAACVILGSTRADVNGLVKKTLDVNKISFAQVEKAVAESQMEFGAITPIGLPPTWPIFIDKAVAESPYVIVGSGVRKSKLAVPGKFLASLPNVQVLEGLGRVVVKEGSI
jgi:prolyl-tRNA editing enzyme YbaK/EbsC (Cys-tRNA(Pro) deacylase)